jgi:hypothetical protein
MGNLLDFLYAFILIETDYFFNIGQRLTDIA